MSAGYELFLPISLKSNNFKKIKFTKSNNTAINHKPFFHFSNEDNTVKLFLDSLTKSSLDDASAYISRNFLDRIDLKEVKSYIKTKGEYKYLIKAGVNEGNKNCKTNSVLIINEEQRNNIIHLHLIREPDKFSSWKIISIEKE